MTHTVTALNLSAVLEWEKMKQLSTVQRKRKEIITRAWGWATDVSVWRLRQEIENGVSSGIGAFWGLGPSAPLPQWSPHLPYGPVPALTPLLTSFLPPTHRRRVLWVLLLPSWTASDSPPCNLHTPALGTPIPGWVPSTECRAAGAEHRTGVCGPQLSPAEF